MSQFDLIPGRDYIDACNAVREKDGIAGLIRSSQLGPRIRALGGDENRSVIFVKAPAGTSRISAVWGGKTREARWKEDCWVLSGLDFGPGVIWVITAASDTDTAVINQPMERLEIKYLTVTYCKIPSFTYTGEYEVVTDEDMPIVPRNTNSGPKFETYKGNWKIRFLTSGSFRVVNLNGWNGYYDVFGIAGGGCSAYGGYAYSGQGGHSENFFDQPIRTDTVYPIEIGAGGDSGTSFNPDAGRGGNTKGLGLSLAGGEMGWYGRAGVSAYRDPGVFEFNGSSGKKYGISKISPGNGEHNTGNGGCNTFDGSQSGYGTGGSGILILRNHR